MTPFASVLLLVAGLTAHQAAPAAPADNAGTYLGILFAPVTSGNLTANAIPEPPGVVVTQVLADSPADKGGVRRNDLLRRYDKEAVLSCEHLAKLIQADKPDRVVQLEVVRGGRTITLEAKLAVGTPLRLAGEVRPAGGTTAAASKPAAPTLSAQVEPLGDGRLKVDLQYYLEGTGRLRSRTLTGTLAELTAEVGKLPEDERRLGKVLLERLEPLIPPARPRP